MQNLQEALIAGGFISQGPSLQQLKADQNFAQQKAEAILAKCEEAGRAPTEAENKEIDMALEAVKSLTSKIQTKQHRLAQRATNQGGVLLIEGGRQFTMPAKRRLSIQYASDFHEYLASRGSKMGDALQEGADGQGGFVIPGLSAASYEGGSTTGQPITPSIVDQQIIELAPAETGVRLAASVIPTVMDIKLPRKTGFGSVAIKAESGGGTNLFADSDATLEQFTLSAFMIGGSHTVSWELMQDVPAFQRFVVTDLLLDHSVYEDNLFVNGNGTGQPEDSSATLAPASRAWQRVATATQVSCSKLPSRSRDSSTLCILAGRHGSSIGLPALSFGKHKMQANLFAPVWTRENGTDYLHGFPVNYSAAMPSIYSGHTPILFGNFKLGYVIGDRGGAGINVKILDQPLATAGQLIILAYRRTDGRIRRSEAIQAITLA